MSTLIVNVLGVAAMLAIAWWFWGWKPGKGAQASNGSLDVEVSNGTYTPSVIEAKAGEPLTLNLLRKAASPCAEYFIIDDLDVSVQLPINKVSSIRLVPSAPGEYRMHCQMNMYQGVLRVV